MDALGEIDDVHCAGTSGYRQDRDREGPGEGQTPTLLGQKMDSNSQIVITIVRMI